MGAADTRGWGEWGEECRWSGKSKDERVEIDEKTNRSVCYSSDDLIDNNLSSRVPAATATCFFPGYPNHGITTTKVEPKPGESVTIGSGAIVRFTLDDLVEKSDTILIGKVVDIFPSRQVDKPPWIVITDVVIEVERYLYGQPQSAYIAVMVPGGRIGERVWLVDEIPVFNLGEEVTLFLHWLQSEITPPDGFERVEYYMVTGAIQGKLSYRDGTMVTWEGSSVALSEVEQKIASIHGGK